MADINTAMILVRSKLKRRKNFVKSLLHFFTDVGDFRMAGKTVYRLDDILCICLLLALKGKFTSFLGAAEYIRFRASYFRKLGLIGDRIPSHDTLRRIFNEIDASELRDAILGRIRKLVDSTARTAGVSKKMRLLSGDGKAFKGSGRKDGRKNDKIRNINVFNILDVSNAVCLASIPLDDKDSEIPAFQSLLRRFNLKNTMVTGDALHCQTKTMEIIIARGGHYTFTVKDNQSSRKAHIIDMMELNSKKIKNFCHNNCEYSVLVIDWGLADGDFPHAEAYVRMVSHKRADQADYNPQPQYFVSSSSNPLPAIETIDNRWCIENDLHGFKDGFNHEDSCTFMDKNAIVVMAVFNNISYSFYRLASAVFGHSGMAETRIRYEECPEEMLAKLIPLMEGQPHGASQKQHEGAQKGLRLSPEKAVSFSLLSALRHPLCRCFFPFRPGFRARFRFS